MTLLCAAFAGGIYVCVGEGETHNRGGLVGIDISRETIDVELALTSMERKH